MNNYNESCLCWGGPMYQGKLWLTFRLAPNSPNTEDSLIPKADSI